MSQRTVAVFILMFFFFSTGMSQSFELSIQSDGTILQSSNHQNYVQLKWHTWKEKGFSTYLLQRTVATGSLLFHDTSWQDVARLDTVSALDTIKYYSYSDYTVSIGTFDYRLSISVNDTPCIFIGLGRITVHSLTGIGSISGVDILVAFECIGNYPNPFNPTTTIFVKLREAKHASIDILDLLGRKVETLASGFLSSGIHQYQWNASKYTSGPYLCILQSSDGVKVTKLVLQK